MEVICFHDEAFYALIEIVVSRIKGDDGVQHDKWISGEEAMHSLNIKSKTTLQKLRNEGKIRYSQAVSKNILYDKDSINKYIEDNAYETFELCKKKKP